MRQFSVVSLFAGCGGLDIGLQGGFTSLGRKWTKNPFKVIWANDFDANACKSYAGYLGNHIVCGDINAILEAPQDYGMPSEADVVTGGFPCQPFSHAGKRLGLQDRRGGLYRPLVVSCGTQQSESMVVVEPGGHVGRLPLSLSTCPRGGCQEHGIERWN